MPYVQRDPASSKWSEMLMDRALRQSQGRMPPPPPGADAMTPEMYDPMSFPRQAAPMGAAAGGGAAISPWLAPALAAFLYPRSTAESNVDEVAPRASVPMSQLVQAQEAMDAAPASPAPAKRYQRAAPPYQMPAGLQGAANRMAVGAAADDQNAKAPDPRELDFIRASNNAMRALKRDDSKIKSGVQTPGGSEMTPMTMDELIRRREESRNALKNQMR